jgi:large subunit ribosomal protein L3
MKFLLGTKGKMTQVYDDKGVIHPGTVIVSGTATVTQVKTSEKDGYVATQIGFGTRKMSNIAKQQQGHLKDLPAHRYLREYVSETPAQRGETIDVSVFKEGDVIAVSSISKGKGFQGVVKRHGFHGGPRSHGNKDTERAPGSIGGGGGRAGGRVAKGMKMAGRTGGDRVTVKNLRVLKVDTETQTVIVSGVVPGRPGTLVEIHG